jgi:hypothetical protein
MQRPSTAETVYKLAIAGEQAGFTLEQMIQILNAGISVETLLNWIELRLRGADPDPLRPTTPMIRFCNSTALSPSLR